MKMAFVISAVLGLTATSAMAECAYHSAQTKVQADQQQASMTAAGPASEQEQAMLTKPASDQATVAN